MDTVARFKAFVTVKSVAVALIVLDPFDEYDTVKLVPVPVEGVPPGARSEERRVGKECISRGAKDKDAQKSPDEGPVIESANGNGLMDMVAVLNAFARLKSVNVALT